MGLQLAYNIPVHNISIFYIYIFLCCLLVLPVPLTTIGLWESVFVGLVLAGVSSTMADDVGIKYCNDVAVDDGVGVTVCTMKHSNNY